MRLSRALFTTWREAPADAETPGIQMLVRAGYVRKVGSGLYAHLPLMHRVVQKLEALVKLTENPGNIVRTVTLLASPGQLSAALLRNGGRGTLRAASGWSGA